MPFKIAEGILVIVEITADLGPAAVFVALVLVLAIVLFLRRRQQP